MTNLGAGLTYSYAEFTPGEVSLMTGLSQELQRVWRRRGQIAAANGATARFDALKVAELFVRHELSLWGCSPKETTIIGSRTAPTILYFALLNGDGACQIMATLGQAEKFIAEFTEEDGFIRKMSGCEDTSRFICGNDKHDFSMAADMASVLAEELRTSILVLDLQLLGTTLADRAPRALVNVVGPSLACERTVRKLTIVR